MMDREQKIKLIRQALKKLEAMDDYTIDFLVGFLGL